MLSNGTFWKDRTLSVWVNRVATSLTRLLNSLNTASVAGELNFQIVFKFKQSKLKTEYGIHLLENFYVSLGHLR